MKKTNKILALALMAVAMVFASCSKDDNDPIIPTQQEIEAKIIGKWKRISLNGVPLLTNLKAVQTFSTNGKGTGSYSAQKEERYVWTHQAKMQYSVTGNVLYIDLKEAAKVEFFESISSISADAFSAHEIRIVVGKENKESETTFQRVTADYSQDIIGMWEGTAMTGYETYGDYHHRIEYRADGTYTYYSWDETTQTWKPLEDVFDEWNVDGDWLATRWQNKGSEVMNYEWWDIDYIKKEGNDIIMKWSALRKKENDERFTTTFTWKKVK